MSAFTVILERPDSLKVLFDSENEVDVYIAQIPDARDTLEAINVAQKEVMQRDKKDLKSMGFTLRDVIPELKLEHYKMVCVLDGLPKVLHYSFN